MHAVSTNQIADILHFMLWLSQTTTYTKEAPV